MPKGTITINASKCPRFRVACHFAGVTIEDIGQQVADEFNPMLKFDSFNHLFRAGELMHVVTDEQVIVFEAVEKALKTLQELRQDLN